MSERSTSQRSESQGSQSSQTNTIARERVDSLASLNGEPAWLRQLRIDAWEAYLQTAMPTGRDEEWHRTEIDALHLTNLQAVDLAKETMVKGNNVPGWLADGLHSIGAAAVISEGVFGLDQPLTKELTNQGVIFSSLKEAWQKHAELLRPLLESCAATAGDGTSLLKCSSTSSSKFGLMNRALFNAGAFLYVPKNVTVQAPFVYSTNLGSLPSFNHQGIAIFPRLIVVLESNSKASVVHVMTSTQPDKPNAVESLVNSSVEVFVNNGAKLDYLELQSFGSDIFAISRTDNEIERDGTLSSLTVALGGLQLKSDIETRLVGPGASSDVEGIIFGDKQEHYSFNTIQAHDAPSTRSNIDFKVALKDQSTSIYQGIIKVDKVAQKTDAYQSNKNLLLGQEAKADSIPKLEILADDVKCSHGATVGPVDKEQLFYLMSRGLSASQAEELIVGGFFGQVLEKCTISGAGAWIDALIVDKIYNKINSQSSKNVSK